MIDVHCHILPDVDDGPKSWEAAEEMCRMASADGIQHIVATPHANDRYHYDRQYLTGLLDRLRQRVGALHGNYCEFAARNLAITSPGRELLSNVVDEKFSGGGLLGFEFRR